MERSESTGTSTDESEGYVMNQYQINQKIRIIISRKEANFDRASDEAYNQALTRFGVDEDGYIKNVVDSWRSTDSLIVKFEEYSRIGNMCGQDHVYSFSAWIERVKDNE